MLGLNVLLALNVVKGLRPKLLLYVPGYLGQF